MKWLELTSFLPNKLMGHLTHNLTNHQYIPKKMCPKGNETDLLLPLKKEREKGPRSSAGLKIATALFFAASSFIVTFVNKSILTTYRFPSFKAIALAQLLATVIVLFVLRKLSFIEFPNLRWGTFDEVFPLPFLHAGGMLLSLGGTKELSIPIFTTIRRFAVMTTMIAEYYVLNVWPPRGVQFSVFIMVFGAIIAITEENFNVFGYTCVLISDVFTSYGSVYTKDILDRSTSMNKYGLLFFNSLFILPVILILAYLDGDLDLAYGFPLWHDVFFSLMFVVSSTVGALLSFSAMLCLLHNSALTTSIVACLKNALVTYVGMYWGQDYAFSWQNFVGINISIFGSLMYTYVILKTSKIEAKPVAEVIVTMGP